MCKHEDCPTTYDPAVLCPNAPGAPERASYYRVLAEDGRERARAAALDAFLEARPDAHDVVAETRGGRAYVRVEDEHLNTLAVDTFTMNDRWRRHIALFMAEWARIDRTVRKGVRCPDPEVESWRAKGVEI